ncbi:hypothetical protein D5S17_11550 [Pseudonocardiaceae bacterium YIM PH 21723]|nr:hypothetical protein D5S17_11550 [Pseudonocardiaceae bacterium YIM PH 21723]
MLVAVAGAMLGSGVAVAAPGATAPGLAAPAEAAAVNHVGTVEFRYASGGTPSKCVGVVIDSYTQNLRGRLVATAAHCGIRSNGEQPNWGRFTANDGTTVAAGVGFVYAATGWNGVKDAPHDLAVFGTAPVNNLPVGRLIGAAGWAPGQTATSGNLVDRKNGSQQIRPFSISLGSQGRLSSNVPASVPAENDGGGWFSQLPGAGFPGGQLVGLSTSASDPAGAASGYALDGAFDEAVRIAEYCLVSPGDLRCRR